jgi:uncharacterized protein
MEIWDIHCHLAGVPGNTPTERVDGLLKYADRMGIARLCLFMGTTWHPKPTPEELRKENDDVLEAVRARPDRTFGFVYLNPKYTEVSLAEMDRCVRDGPMIGVKLWYAMHCNAPQLDPIARRAAELGIPVLQHTWLINGGNKPGESTPMELAELAARHPKTTFLCAHTGGDWERGIRAIRPLPNIYADICGGEPSAGFVELAVAELGAERVLYGSDAGGRSYATQLAKVLDANVPDSAKRLILAGNARRLLEPILKKKGMVA